VLWWTGFTDVNNLLKSLRGQGVLVSRRSLQVSVKGMERWANTAKECNLCCMCLRLA
jgi:hypothetical protein